ncbi:MAG: hypothetical protein K9G42_08930 [Pedobacter sp.]|nr:hypothetical protein [Pedobacter sp.]
MGDYAFDLEIFLRDRIRHFEHISNIFFLSQEFAVWRNLLMVGSAFDHGISLRDRIRHFE